MLLIIQSSSVTEPTHTPVAPRPTRLMGRQNVSELMTIKSWPSYENGFRATRKVDFALPFSFLGFLPGHLGRSRLPQPAFLHKDSTKQQSSRHSSRSTTMPVRTPGHRRFHTRWKLSMACGFRDNATWKKGMLLSSSHDFCLGRLYVLVSSSNCFCHWERQPLRARAEVPGTES